MTKTYIFGTSSIGRLAHSYLTRDLGQPVNAFLVDQEFRDRSSLLDTPVSAIEDVLPFGKTARVFIAIGYRKMRDRKSLFDRLIRSGATTFSIVAPSAYIGEGVEMGTNNIIMPGVVIEAGCRIGDNNIFWSNTTICHDTRIGDHNFFAANSTIGGYVTIDSLCFFGFSSVVTQSNTIASESLVAAGAMILADTAPQGRYQGTPARRVADLDARSGIEIID